MSWKPSVLVVIFQGGDRINSSKPVNRVKHGKLTGPKACLWALSRASLGPWEEKPSYHGLKGNRGEKWERKRDNFQRCWVRNERRLDKNPCKEKPVKGDIVSDKAETKGREKLKVWEKMMYLIEELPHLLSLEEIREWWVNISSGRWRIRTWWPQFFPWISESDKTKYCHESEKWKSLNRVQLFATPWAVWSMDFSRPEYWSGEPFPSPGGVPSPGNKPKSPSLQGVSLPAELPGKP